MAANLSMASWTIPGVRVVVRVDRLAALEVDIRVLGGAAQHRAFGDERAGAVCADQFFVDHGPHIFDRSTARSC